MALNLIIKGNVAQATQAAHDRGISLNQAFDRSELFRITGPFNETNARCAEEYRSRVAAWFAEEPRQAPYPVGALLLFS